MKKEVFKNILKTESLQQNIFKNFLDKYRHRASQSYSCVLSAILLIKFLDFFDILQNLSFATSEMKRDY